MFLNGKKQSSSYIKWTYHANDALYFQFYQTFIDNKEILNIPFQSQYIKQNVIIHGTDDQVVPFSDAEFLVSRIIKSALV